MSAYLMPAYPLYLSVLNRADKNTRMRLRHANLKEAGELARDLSARKNLFIVILDDAGERHGAFLKGEYIDSSVTDEQLIEIATRWQRTPQDDDDPDDEE